MRPGPKDHPIPALWNKVRRILRRKPEPEHPDDPYALVGARKKPRLPAGSAAVAEKPER